MFDSKDFDRCSFENIFEACKVHHLWGNVFNSLTKKVTWNLDARLKKVPVYPKHVTSKWFEEKQIYVDNNLCINYLKIIYRIIVL